ncbi:MAG: carboxypeptidase-like regulatory domain-containing protein [Chitinophagaceae bacterium]|nr:carboxypeptidase-like regulatory domain-containing protein [Chitinophagaceae bacterium]
MRKYLFIFVFFFLLNPLLSFGQQYILEGTVTNSSLEPLSFVTVQLKGLQIGTRTNEKGHYQFQLEEGEYEIVYSLLGYKKQSIKFVHRKGGPPQNIIMEDNSSGLNEVKVVSFKKDKAEEIIKQVIQRKEKILSDANSYSTNVYIRATQENEKFINARKLKKLSDSARIALEKSLPQMSMSEVYLQLDYTYPNKIKEKRLGVNKRADESVKQSGDDNNLFYLSTTEGDFSLYHNLIRVPALSEIPMLSPISYSGLVAYKYKTKNIFKKENYTIYTIQFMPTKLGNALIEGEVQIVDTSWTIIHSTYTFPKFHMPEYDYFQVDQQNQFVDDKAWLPVRQEFIYHTKQGRSKSSGRTIAIYENYKIDTQFNKKYFNREVSSTSIEAYKRDSNFWTNVRKEPLNEQEIKFVQKSDSIYRHTNSKVYLDSVDKINNKVTFLKVFALGLNFYKREKERNISIAPLISIYRPLLPGGARIALSGGYSKIFPNKTSLGIRGEINYGIRNHDFMGDLTITRIYNPFSQGYFEISGGRSFDLIFTGDAFVNLFRRSNFYIKNSFEAEHGLELFNGLIFRSKFEFAERQSIDQLKLSRQYDTLFKYNNEPVKFEPYNAMYINLTLEYTPFQMYIREPQQKIILGSNYPTAYVRWRKGIPNLLSSDVDFDYLEFGIRQKLKLGLAGISQFQIFTGEFMSKKELRYIDYKFISRGNPYLFNNPLRSFQALDSTFNVFKRFYEGHYLHHFNGSILNKIPLLKKINLLEVAGGGILFVPERKLNYAEAYVGIEKIIRIWRERFKIGFYVVGSLANKYNNPYQIKFGLDQFNKKSNSWY